MDGEHTDSSGWQRLDDCFNHATGLDPVERAKYLASLRAEDPEFAALVSDLVQEPLDESSFLRTSPGDVERRGIALQSGHVIADRFEIIDELGQGGMGNVYKAYDRHLEAHVALKTIRPELMHDGGIRVRFKHEIRNGQRVAHENVCRIHDLVVSHGDNGAPLAFTMELLEGETLREFLERKGKLSIEQALPLVRQMADGLSALHGRNVVHRDFKPGNIFVIEHTDGRIEVKITDFGLARQTFGGEEGGSRDSRSLGPIGTPRYMAPEQIDPDRGEIGPSTDVFAFGIVLYEMLTGANPFPAASLAGNLKEKTEGKPPPPQTLTAGIDKK